MIAMSVIATSNSRSDLPFYSPERGAGEGQTSYSFWEARMTSGSLDRLPLNEDQDAVIRGSNIPRLISCKQEGNISKSYY